MSRSQPKPKIIYKNLQDLIKSSSLSKNSSKNVHSQRANTQPLSQIINLKQSNSIPVRKTKFIQVNRTQTNEETNNNGQLNGTTQIYSACYNEIDAIFTELQDFFCQSKDQVLQQLRDTLQLKNNKNKYSKKAQQKVEELRKMSDYIKHISNFFVHGQVPNLSKYPEEGSQYSYSKNIQSGNNQKTNTEMYQDQSRKILTLSMKNSKVRANRRGQMINNRKKTVYELILQQKQNKSKLSTSGSRKAI